MSLINNSNFGMEEVQRAILLQIFEVLPVALAEQESFGNDQDAVFFAALGRDMIETTLEPIAPENFYVGHVPSLIHAPVDSYPNVAVIVPQTTPASGTESIDQGEAYRNAVFVDVMCKSLTDEQEVNRRIIRTTEAVNRCVMRDQTLGGIVTAGFESAPQALIGDVFTRREKTSYGQHWFWQGARLEYAVRKESVNPPASTGSIFRTASEPQPAWAGADFDQA